MDNNRTTSDRGLLLSAIRKFGLGMLILGLFLFLCAGDLRYWNGWVFLGAFCVCLLFFGLYLYRNDQALLRKRLNAKEKEPEQRAYTFLASLSFLLTFGLCGFDYRFKWSFLPVAGVFIALVMMIGGFGLFVLTLMQNSFASRTIEIQSGQRVIDTGVYSVVRHPMYTAALLMFFACPFVQGSYYGALPMLLFLLGIVLRIRNEEKVLSVGLEGYAAYREKVKYRLIPFIW